MKKILFSAIISLGMIAFANQAEAQRGTGYSVIGKFPRHPNYHTPIPPGPPVYELKGNVRDSLIKAGLKVEKLKPIGNTIQGKNLDSIARICRKASILGRETCEYYGIPKSNKDLALVKPAEKGEVEEFQYLAAENPDLYFKYDRKNDYFILIKKSGDE